MANLAAGGSVHTATFLRAVALATELLVPRCAGDLALVLVSDNADATGACDAADYLLRANAQAVVGHYASVAALAAAPRYAEAGVPLLLPAATADALVDGFANTLRLCGADSQLAVQICQDLKTHFGISRVALRNDGGVHGRSLCAAIATQLAHTEIAAATAFDDAQLVLFCGGFRESVVFVKELRQRSCDLPVLLTDDAVHPSLAAAIKGCGDVYSYGFGPADWHESAQGLCRMYRARWHDEPGVYFLETFAALELVAHWVQNGIPPQRWVAAAHDRAWPTILGATHFVERQRPDPAYALWAIEPNGLRASRRLGT